MKSQPLLSICIPIYNREQYLERMLSRFMEDNELFKEEIYLFIADNCSQDDLGKCCRKYQAMGLNLEYHRNDENIGPDRNFELCFHRGKGKYTWLLGSDDIPVSGFLRELLSQLRHKDYGLFHLSMKPRKEQLTEYTVCDEMVVAVNYWITFMSANIIRTDTIGAVDFSDYRQSNMIQVPAYLNACCTYKNNAICYLPQFFEKESDGANNGGYNLFKVFVTNLYGIYDSYVKKGLLSQNGFNKVIKVEFKDFLCGYIIDLLVLKRRRNFITDDAWHHLSNYYIDKPYAYFYLFGGLVKRLFGKILHNKV